jgi:hypothetical protein
MDKKTTKLLFIGNSATYVHEVPETLAKLATTGINAPPYFKCGHRCLYKESDLRKWMESKMVRRFSTSVEASND